MALAVAVGVPTSAGTVAVRPFVIDDLQDLE
jgi:hypothetical protein